jgi:signal transduction histidine kinase
VNEGLASTLDSDFGEAVEQLLEEGRQSASRRPERRQLAVEAAVGGAFLVTAVLMAALLPAENKFSFELAAAYTIAFAVLASVRFEVGAGLTYPTQVLFVPMLFQLPARTVPLLVAAGLLLSEVPEYLTGRRHGARAIYVFADAWFAIGPALLFSLAHIDGPAWSDWPIYVGALGAQIAIDTASSSVREWIGRGVAPRLQLGVLGWVYLVDVLLSSVGLLVAFAAEKERYAFLLLLPLAALFAIFASERRARIENALRLSSSFRERADLSERLLETERAAARSREELIAGASHEMQTPLAVLLGLLDAGVRDERTLERPAEAFEGMRRQAIRLQHLVRQFTDYTRLKAGRPLQFDARPSNVRSVVVDVADSQRGYASVELDLPEDLPEAIVDPDRLHQILMNLISNAVKFSPPGSPTTVAARALEASIEISVTDRGVGIEEAELVRLFDELHRGEGEHDGGAGLGLYMARTLAEVQGGQVLVESRPGEGSCFTIVLPRAP